MEQAAWVLCQFLEFLLALLLVQAVLEGQHSQMVPAAVANVSQVRIFGEWEVLVLSTKNMSLLLTLQR